MTGVADQIVASLPAPDDGLRGCDACAGDFLPEDLDGDHCRDCADELFGDMQ